MNTEPAKTIPRAIKSLGLILPVLLVCSFLFFTSGAVHFTSQTQFCTSCHEMNGAVESWQASTHGSNELGIVAQCKDCHIPTNMVGMMGTKVQKLNELYVHVVKSPTEFEFSRMQPALAIRARGKIPDQNCLECHNLQDQVPKNQNQAIAHSTAVGITNCASCHQEVGHEKSHKKEGDLL